PFFSVNVLEQSQRDVSRVFASQAMDKFDHVPWEHRRENVPLLSGSLARFVCETERQIDAGDHAILLGKVKDFDYRDGTPLSYFRGQYVTLDTRKDGEIGQKDTKTKPAFFAGK
ncbi:MAG: flavin reductase family protein, partial [Paracoccaceae bacterium]